VCVYVSEGVFGPVICGVCALNTAGRDLLEVCRRLPEDIPYLLNRLPDDMGRALRGIEHPKEVCLGAIFVSLAIAWFLQNLHLLEFLNLRKQLYGDLTTHTHTHTHTPYNQACQPLKMTCVGFWASGGR